MFKRNNTQRMLDTALAISALVFILVLAIMSRMVNGRNLQFMRMNMKR